MNNYYYIEDHKQISENAFSAAIRLPLDCKVYEGHFPTQPVAPGASNIEMIKQFVELLLIENGQLQDGQTICLSEIKRCKFLRPIIPSPATVLVLQVTFREENTFGATLSENDTICVNMKAKFSKIRTILKNDDFLLNK